MRFLSTAPNGHVKSTYEPPRVVVEPRKPQANGWLVLEGDVVIAEERKLADAEHAARQALARLGGGRLELHLRYGRTRMFERVGIRAARQAD